MRVGVVNGETSAPRRACILIVDDDSGVTESLAFALNEPGRRIVVCSDTEAADLVVDHFDVTHVVTDVQFSGAMSAEGMHLLHRLRRDRPHCRVAVMTGRPSDPLRAEAMAYGASALLAKPFDTEELEQALALARLDDDEVPGEIVRVPGIDEILAGDELSTVYQPIVALDGRRATVGYESLARLRGGWPVGSASAMFEYGHRRNRLVDLNLMCLRRAIAGAALLPAHALLFINLDPIAFTRPSLVSFLESQAARVGIELSRIVIEITERAAFASDSAVALNIEELRGAGVRFALDDLGSAYSHLDMVEAIAPSFMKIGQSFGTDFEIDAAKQRVVQHVLTLAEEFECGVIIEGVESEDTAAAAAYFGIGYAQGYRFGRPAEQWPRSTTSL